MNPPSGYYMEKASVTVVDNLPLPKQESRWSNKF
jgi:hypothetical protein